MLIGQILRHHERYGVYKMCNSFKNGWIAAEKLYMKGIQASFITIYVTEYDEDELKEVLDNCCFGC